MPKKYLLISALRKIIEADFKSVQKKFMNQGVDAEVVKQYLNDFKKLRDTRDLGEHKDIDRWGKKPWGEFKEFVDNTKKTKTRSQEKKEEKGSGAELVAKNKDWLIYKILTHKAAMKYGAGTRWCITEEDGQRWREYSRVNSFYFAIFRNHESIREKDAYGLSEHPLYKVAIQVNKKTGNVHYWNAEDLSLTSSEIEARMNKSNLPAWPDYKFESFELDSDMSNVVKKVRSTKVLDDESKQIIEDAFDIEIVDYIPEKNFLVLEKCQNIDAFAKEWTYDGSLRWNLKILSGDEFLEPDVSSPGIPELTDWLNILEDKHKELYEKLIDKVFSNKEIVSDGIFLEEIRANDPERDGPFTLDSFKKSKWKNKILANVIHGEYDTDLTLAFTWALADAMRSATESELYNKIKRQLEENDFIHFTHWDAPIEVGITLSDLYHWDGEDMTLDIEENLRQQIGVDRLDYEYPEDKEVVYQLVDFRLSEYI